MAAQPRTHEDGEPLAVSVMQRRLWWGFDRRLLILWAIWFPVAVFAPWWQMKLGAVVYAAATFPLFRIISTHYRDFVDDLLAAFDTERIYVADPYL